MRLSAVFTLTLISLLGLVRAQQKCPSDLGWYKYWNSCYRFEAFPRMTQRAAADICKQDGAHLLSLASKFEHEFIKNWLLENDLRRIEWLTSGVTSNSESTQWTGDNSGSSFDVFIDAAKDTKKTAGLPVIYSYTGVDYGWNTGDMSKDYAFICEIELNEVYKIVQEYRDFDYGIMNIDNPRDAPRGPTFLQQPKDTVVLGNIKALSLECLADGNPEPSYEWVMMRGNQWVPVPPGDRYTMTTGKLEITDPHSSNDVEFQCKASNSQGTVLSTTAIISFGQLDDFPNSPPAAVIADEYKGLTLKCPEVIGKPAKTYNWFKDSLTNVVRPRYQKHSFMSANGNLYFSEVTRSDAGEYFCMVDIYSYGFDSRILTAASKSVTSMGLELKVTSGGGSNEPVLILSEFPYIFPSTPVKGGDVRLECFAYGTGPLIYTWSRANNKPLPNGHSLDSNNRIIYLTNLEQQDGGVYTCTVKSTTTKKEESKSTTLIIQARPYFTYPLSHMHLDVGARLTWHCEAAGQPTPRYSWFKNGNKLQSDIANGIKVEGNTLSINKVDAKRDNGMYQCAADNRHGRTFSTAQLRVVELAPTFERNPMTKSMYAASTGQVTIMCSPMAAPTPTFRWLKDGSDLNLDPNTPQNEGDHYRLLRNGNLIIFNIQMSDQGRYTCEATNSVGKDDDYTDLVVLEGSVITQSPADDKVEVNLTATLLCRASHAKNLDMIYEWKFNDHVIDYYIEPEYRQGEGNMKGSLYVVAAQYRNEGEYTCTARTSMDSFSRSAYLEVLGPPGEPAGVDVRTASTMPEGVLDLSNSNSAINPNTTRWVVWIDGQTHGGDITHYFVEFRTEFNKEWRVHPDANNIPVFRATSELLKNQRFARLTNLKAYAGIFFRVRARNTYGIGAPSLPTEMTRIVGSKPTETVKNLRGGGGSVGDLTIVWDSLPREDHNGPDLEYIVYWRPYNPNSNNGQWSSKLLPEKIACQNKNDYRIGEIYNCDHVAYVGAQNFYMPYEVQVRTKNKIGDGPASEIARIMSAEDLPLGVPEKVFGHLYNATALLITWKPVPNTRASARGKLKGYKINYWRENVEDESQALQNIVELKPGQDNLNRGIIIGLQPTYWYKFNVQAYNTAGNGDKSSDYSRQTLNKEPSQYPTEVHVFSVEGYGVRVNFRGISTQIREEPLRGYKVQYWKANENMLGGQEADFGLMTTGVLRNLSSSEIYQLRVLGYSRAGYGRRSNPAIFFTVGDGQIVVNPETTEIFSGSSTVLSSLSFIVCMLSLTFIMKLL